MPITIKNIAKYAKVSPATVSLALQNKQCVALKTRERIQQLAADLGYMPSGLGRALQSGKSGLIGYLIPHVSSSYFNEILQGVGLEAAAQGYGLLTAITGGSDKETIDQLKIFREKRIDGLLCSACSSGIFPHLMDFEKSGCPLTFCSMESPLPEIPFSITDDIAGGKMAAAHLLKMGAKKIAYFHPRNYKDKRFEGASELAQIRFLGSEEELSNALKSELRPDAVIAYCDDDAVKAMKIIAGRGLKIPDNVMLVGFDNSPFTDFPGINLSSVAPQKRQIGEDALRILIRRIEGSSPKSVFLAPSLVARASSGMI